MKNGINQPTINSDLGKIHRLLEVYNYQFITNELVHPNWIGQNFNWTSAVIAEVGELLDSIGYKWWKDQEFDYENSITELVDIFHFLVSLSIQIHQSYIDHHYLSTILSVYYDAVEYSESEYELLTTPKDDVLIQLANEIAVAPSKFISNDKMLSLVSNESRIRDTIRILFLDYFKLLVVLGEDIDGLFNRYIIKNALNNTRTSLGYKDGTYKKLWYYGPSDEVLEDNTVAIRLINELGTEGLSVDSATEFLINYYKTNEDKHE